MFKVVQAGVYIKLFTF